MHVSLPIVKPLCVATGVFSVLFLYETVIPNHLNVWEHLWTIDLKSPVAESVIAALGAYLMLKNIRN